MPQFFSKLQTHKGARPMTKRTRYTAASSHARFKHRQTLTFLKRLARMIRREKTKAEGRLAWQSRLRMLSASGAN